MALREASALGGHVALLSPSLALTLLLRSSTFRSHCTPAGPSAFASVAYGTHNGDAEVHRLGLVHISAVALPSAGVGVTRLSDGLVNPSLS